MPTATQLYSYTQCPHRVWRDIHGPKQEKSPETNPFVELLWRKGILHEEKVIRRIGDILDLSEGSHDERFKKTTEAMKAKTPLIYQGLLKHKTLLGIPDLLKLQPDNTYIPVDIKSGMAIEGVDEEKGKEGKYKKHYALQLCLYAELLINLGFAHERKGIIIDAHKNEVTYDLTETWWELYEQTKQEIELLTTNKIRNKPAMAGVCKLCPWYDSCKKWCDDNQDLTGIFYLGRSNRDTINDDLSIDKIDELLDMDIESILKEKKKDKRFLPGLAETSLNKILRRAIILQKTKEPVAYEPIVFPKTSYELFFDIEDDPTQEFVYMHGVCERHNGKTRYIHFTATELSDTAEKKAWADFWKYIASLPKDDFSVYYYSPHEKTTYTKLQKQYPDVISIEEVENFFNDPNVIDLYNAIVLKHTDWPLGSYSLKAIATYLGFKWRDESPSGALSIEWFNKYIETKDEETLKRILEYNEDDCKATMVMKDNLEKL
jgi:uncharacterized protein